VWGDGGVSSQCRKCELEFGSKLIDDGGKWKRGVCINTITGSCKLQMRDASVDQHVEDRGNDQQNYKNQQSHKT